MRKLTALSLALWIVLISSIALAETKIKVNGLGEVQISADTAIISLGINTSDRDVLIAQKNANETIKSIRQALIDQGIEMENINTEYIHIYPIYEYQYGQEQVAAYDVSSSLAIMVTDIESVDELIDVCLAAGANTLNGIVFAASDSEEAIITAMRKAAYNAKKKAEILAETEGLKISGIEEISECSINSYGNSTGKMYEIKVKEQTEVIGGSEIVFQAEKVTISVLLNIIFTAE